MFRVTSRGQGAHLAVTNPEDPVAKAAHRDLAGRLVPAKSDCRHESSSSEHLPEVLEVPSSHEIEMIVNVNTTNVKDELMLDSHTLQIYVLLVLKTLK